MEQRKEFLSKIKDTEPTRDMGSLSGLKESLEEVGLINPITIDTKRNLLAGRRRYHAMKELGWKKCAVNILDPENDVGAKTIALHENLKRKPLSDPENRRLIAELDELLRKKFGESKGGERTDLHEPRSDLEQGWSFQKTASKIGIAKSTVSEAKTAEEFVKTTRPDLRHTKTPIVLDIKKKEQILDSIEDDSDRRVLKEKAKSLTAAELKGKVERGKEIEATIKKVHDPVVKKQLERQYLPSYTKFETSPETVKRQISRSRGLSIEDKRRSYDDLLIHIRRYIEDNPQIFMNVRTSSRYGTITITIQEGAFTPLQRVDFPELKFSTDEEAEVFANARGGYSSGKQTIAGNKVWVLMLREVKTK